MLCDAVWLELACGAAIGSSLQIRWSLVMTIRTLDAGNLFLILGARGIEK